MKRRYLSGRQVRAAYVLYTHGWSVMDIAEQMYARAGYSSAVSLRSALTRAFEAYELPRRNHSEATLALNARRRQGQR